MRTIISKRNILNSIFFVFIALSISSACFADGESVILKCEMLNKKSSDAHCSVDQHHLMIQSNTAKNKQSSEERLLINDIKLDYLETTNGGAYYYTDPVGLKRGIAAQCTNTQWGGIQCEPIPLKLVRKFDKHGAVQ